MIDKVSSIKNLLESSGRIAKHQEEIKRLRGENFNVFSILGMESRENETHSAFVGELLNPRGSHQFGNSFLKLFLDTVGYKGDFDIHSARLVLEKHVGSRDDEAKQGGRIDIYLIDAFGVSISIENKIYASDQFAQIERYVNHNQEKNTVYYLTLNGADASDASAGDLEEGEHYYAISYESTIIDWLNRCLKEATEQPILRESIKQYSILIKKLTNQLTDPKMEKEIIDLIANNYQEAKIIEANLRKVEISIANAFLQELKKRLSKECNDEKWVLKVSDNLENSYEGFTLHSTEWPNDLAIKLEGQSKIPYHNVVLGIVCPKSKIDREVLLAQLDGCGLREKGYTKESRAWPYYGYVLSWRNDEKRAELFDPKKREVLLNDMEERILWLISNCNASLSTLKEVLVK